MSAFAPRPGPENPAPAGDIHRRQHCGRQKQEEANLQVISSELQVTLVWMLENTQVGTGPTPREFLRAKVKSLLHKESSSTRGKFSVTLTQELCPGLSNWMKLARASHVENNYVYSITGHIGG